jgi:GTP cyclohydrolase I
MMIEESSRTNVGNLSSVSTEALYRELLHRFDEDATRDGVLKTPERAAKAMQFLTGGRHQMVIVRDIEMYSLCEHHMLPFFGRVHIAYIPNGKVVGLSKLPRLVDVFARRLQVQERMTRQIADALKEAINPQGVGVVIEAQHLCMMMRGVEKQQSSTITSAMFGAFREKETRDEFLALIQARHTS